MRDIIEIVIFVLLNLLFAYICIICSIKAIKKLKGLRHGSVHRMRIVKYERTDNHLGGRYRVILHTIIVSSEDDDPAVFLLSTNSHKGARYKDMEYADIYSLQGQKEAVLKEDIPHLYFDAILGLIVGMLCLLLVLFIALALIDKCIYNFGLLDSIQDHFY